VVPSDDPAATVTSIIALLCISGPAGRGAGQDGDHEAEA